MSTTQALWDRLRAALDAWEAPRGLSLRHAIDERAGRFAFSLAAECGGVVSADFVGMPDDRDLGNFIAQVPSRLDYAAYMALRDHICCCGRLPRAVRRAGRHFEQWVDDYKYLHRYHGEV